ncbi:MAG: hypothetical protein HFI67_12200 [Lachnospiraceae bacterium]|jgi:hypothetical protein|nr:hypothetical protein [Lachnospiraceae bacterium]
MEYKYKLFNTASKTAKENNLILSRDKDKKMFDFSLLDTIKISEEEKEIIKKYALKYVDPAFKKSMYGEVFSYLHNCNGIALYHIQKVFSKNTGRRLYSIFILTKIKHYTNRRKSIYEECYDSVEYKADNQKIESLIDIEL